MKKLSIAEIGYVSGGELTCTAGTSGVNCSGSLTDWTDATDGFSDWVSSFFGSDSENKDEQESSESK